MRAEQWREPDIGDALGTPFYIRSILQGHVVRGIYLIYEIPIIATVRS